MKKLKIVSFKIEPDLYLNLKSIAEKEDVSMAVIIRRALRAYLANYKPPIKIVKAGKIKLISVNKTD